MQIKVSKYHFIIRCLIFLFSVCGPFTGKAQQQNDSTLMRSYSSVNDSLTILLPNAQDSLSGIVVMQDSVAADSVLTDSVEPRRPMFNAPIHYRAKDTMRISLPTKKVTFNKEAEVKYQQTELKAEFISIDMERKEAFATGVEDSLGNLIGKPHFADGGNQFDSKELRYNFETEKGFVKNIIMQEGEGFLQGELTKKMTDDLYFVKEGKYTTCDCHDHPHFHVRINKAVMIRDKKVIAGFSNLVIEDVPLPLFLPFGFFPITKKGTSGVIMPTYGEERMRGFNLKNGGYYWAINDYVDLSVTGDIYSNGSWGGSLISNYRKRYRFSGNFSYTMSKNHTGEKAIPENYQESNDWSIIWTHTQDQKANPYSTFSASVNMSSASSNYYNATNIYDIANQRKQSSVSWSKKWPDSPFSLSAAFNHNQNSKDSTLTISFPNINFKMSNIYPLRKKGKTSNLKWWDNIGVSYTAELKNSLTAKENEFLDKSLNEWSNGFRHSIPVSPSINLVKDISFNPSFSYSGVAFLSSIRKEFVDTTGGSGRGYVRTDTISGFHYAHNYTGSLSLAYNPTIYGMYMFKETSRIFAIRHMIRPSISVSYSPKIGVKRNKYKRSYIDGSGNEVWYSMFEGKMYSVPETPEKGVGRINFSVTNNVEMKIRNDNDSTGSDKYRKAALLESFTISTSYNIFADSMRWSNISLSARTAIFNKKMNINLTGEIDPYYLDQNNVRLNKFSGGLGRLTRVSFSTGYSFSSDNGANKEQKNDLVGGFYDKYTDFDVPWTFSFDYTLSMNTTYSRNDAPGATRAKAERKLTQNLRFNGDFSLTPKWKLGFSSGYDFENKEVTSTSFNISRDLHCWDMSFSCIPFGTHRSFDFKINVRSSLLKDLKLTKRSSFYDR